jgi:hypothetical protein
MAKVTPVPPAATADSIKPSKKNENTTDKSRRNQNRNEDFPDKVTVKSKVSPNDNQSSTKNSASPKTNNKTPESEAVCCWIC